MDKITPTLEFEKLQINPSAYQVFQGGKEILLTKSEFELLFYLAQYSGMVRTREQLYERIWGGSSQDKGNALYCHIRNLRDKLGDDPENPKYIKTIPGVGYRFEGKEGI